MESTYTPLLPICSDCPNMALRKLDIVYAYDDMEHWKSEALARRKIENDPCTKPVGEITDTCRLPNAKAVSAILIAGLEMEDYRKTLG